MTRSTLIPKARNLQLLLALFIGTATQAQSRSDVDNVYVYGTIKDDSTRFPVVHAAVIIREDSLPLVSASVDSGKYECNLEFDHVYRLRYEAPGYVAKFLEIDTRNIPTEMREGGFGINVEMTLSRFFKYGDYSLLQEPIGKARYVPADSMISWDLQWTEMMRERFRVAKARSDSLAALPPRQLDLPEDPELEQWRRYGTITGVVVALLGMIALVVWIARRQRKKAQEQF
ncbi:MAG: hypothetical protein IPP33_11155 [Flavobacteriales bacterium]|nr:hypothetical protein [Flavobacteriales bacterium]